MAIFLPIISEFKDTGIKKAIKEFKSLDGAAAKASFAIKKAAVPAAAALTGLAVAGLDAAKAAAEDAAAAEQLATQLRNSVKATDEQIAATEDFITKTSIAAAVSDDELRPALASLVRGTGDLAQAQDLLGLALDISAGTGKDLGEVSDALSKAYNGNFKALAKLDPSLKKAIDSGATLDGIFANLENTFQGAADTAANTATGKFKSLQISLDETKEALGAALLPALISVADKLLQLTQFVQENQTAVLVAVGVFAGLATAVLVINAAIATWTALTAAASAATAIWNAILAANPMVLIVIAVIAVIAALVVLQKKFDIFGKAIEFLGRLFQSLWDGIKTGLEFVWGLIKRYVELYVAMFQRIIGVFTAIKDAIIGAFKTAFNAVARLWNSTIGALVFKVPDWVPGIGGKGFDVPDIPLLASGGIVKSPTLAMIGEAGPEAVVPLDQYGRGGNTYITVQGALDPVGVATQIRRLLNDDARRSGRIVLV